MENLIISAEKIIDELVEKETKGVVEDIKKSINKIIEEGISSNLSKMMLEGEIYKTINKELQNGLTNIFKDINSANKEAGSGVAMDKKTEELFTEASEQLDAIVQTTEEATEDIIGVISKQVELQAKDALQLKWKLVDLTECRSY